jgi:GTP-binding protein
VHQRGAALDVPDGRDISSFVVEELRGRGLRVFEISAASGEGLQELMFAMAEIVARARAERPVAETTRIILRPGSVDGSDQFSVEATSDGWRVRGTKPERWVRQTDFSNDEAVGFLADRLNKLGVEAKLVSEGALEGDTVIIGAEDNAVVFDFRPGIDAGVEMLGRRGEDQRFDESRPAAKRRREIDELFGIREEGQARADVAAKVDKRGGNPGPMSYEIGGKDDPDWAESDPDA